jgi:cytochrome c oxidase subunit 1/cytochrome c oxidase subunit I+III
VNRNAAVLRPGRVGGPRELDVSALAPGGFGHRSILFWGTAGLCLIEGTAFVLAIAAYFYIRLRNDTWPPNMMPPLLRWGTINTIILLVSGVPNQITRMAAERLDLAKVRLWLVVCLLFGVAFNVVRVFEFGSLNVLWSDNAYGSIVWMLLGLHTTHIVTDVLDTGVLTLLMFTGPVEEKRFVDVSENAMYWYFVVLTWLPIYGVIYWAPRLT